MAHSPKDQLDAIHAMLSAGHRNLRIERHTLVLWGLASGSLFLLSERILTHEQLPDTAARAAAWLALIVTVLASVSVVDWRLTRSVKQARDEAWSFIHRQVLKVWWLLMGLGALLTFATFFFGGGYMLCSAWLVLLGVGLYIHGLFSEEQLEWVGGAVILSGIGCLSARLPFDTMTWIAASVCGIGLPLLSFMLDRGRHRSLSWRFAQTLLWLAVVLTPPAFASRFQPDVVPPETPVYTLQQFLEQPERPGLTVVSLPAGMVVPVQMEMGGTLFAAEPKPNFSLTLSRPVQLLLKDGQPTGAARRGDEPWNSAQRLPWIFIPWIRGEITDRGPIVRGRLVVRLQDELDQ